MSGQAPRERAFHFLSVSDRFRLGHLPTELPHPRTVDLSRWAKHDLDRGIAVLKSLDLDALHALGQRAPEIEELSRTIASTLERGRRVYLCGCGATGRLSLSLEYLWRRKHGDDGRVVSFMAGGDVALVHALEGFEDHPAHGARHLTEAGFAQGDLLIACTEGGETPYVIGAAERAAELSTTPPCFLYCNADAPLLRGVERFRRIHADSRIRKLCLDVGPMALAGSTRMQASTVLQLAVGLALLHPERRAHEVLGDFRRCVDGTDFTFLRGLIEREASIYLAGHCVVYRVRDYGITVFTDTTERAPTFSLLPFERLGDPVGQPSLCYLVLADAESPAEAWQRLLLRAPRPLDWPEVDPRATSDYLCAFDFSARALDLRRRRVPDRQHHEFDIAADDEAITLRLDGVAHAVPVAGVSELLRHLLLKQLLNIHSTLVMGRLGRYESNLMTWVRPTNGKLVDRAARYVGYLLERAGRKNPRYEDIVLQLFEELDRGRADESVVLRTYRALLDGLPGRVVEPAT